MKYVCILVLVWQYATVSCRVFPPNGALLQYFTERWYNNTLTKVIDVLQIPQIPERYVSGNEKIFKNTIRDPVLRFSWSNCGSTSDPVQIKSLSISPDPLHLPGDVTLAFDITTSVAITAPLELKVTIKKKVAFVWIEIPCIEQEGSCTYSDVCTILPQQCPPEFVTYNIPCHCPASQGEYNFPEGQISLPALPLPSWATHGDYKAEAVGSLNGKQLFCYDVTLSLN